MDDCQRWRGVNLEYCPLCRNVLNSENVQTMMGRRLAKAVALARGRHARVQHGVTGGAGLRLGRRVGIHALHGASIEIGDRVEIGEGTSIIAQTGATIIIGDDVFISGMCIIAAAEWIGIGCDSMVAELVCIRDHDHDPDQPPRSGAVLRAPVRIGDRCWIGSKASIVRGGQVGDDSVVGAHALVNRAIPAGCVAAGVPAVVKRRKSR